MMLEQELQRLLSLQPYEANHGNVNLRSTFRGVLELVEKGTKDECIILCGIVPGSDSTLRFGELLRLEPHDDEQGDISGIDHDWLREHAIEGREAEIRVLYDCEGPKPRITTFITIIDIE